MRHACFTATIIFAAALLVDIAVLKGHAYATCYVTMTITMLFSSLRLISRVIFHVTPWRHAY